MKKLIILFYIAGNFTFNSNAQVVVKGTKDGMLWEISNGNLGIGIPSEASYKKNELQTLSPIQYFIYPNGQKSDDTPNYLEMLYPGRGGSGPLNMKVIWLKKDPSEYAVRIEYSFKKNDFNFYDKSYPGGGAGMGYYKCTISVKKGEKNIMILEEHDYEISYSVKISKGLEPNMARFRGWNTESTAYGFEKPGIRYRDINERGYPMDATRDISYNKKFSLPFLPFWSVSGGEQNTGRYWMLYNDKADQNNNLIGIFAGRPSKLLGANGYGVCFSFSDMDVQKGRDANITVWHERRGPDNSWNPKKRFEWGVFISTKKDLLPPEKTQPIFIAMNQESGLGKQINDYASRKAELNVNFMNGAIFCNESKIQGVIERIKKDEGFYKYMIVTDNYYKPVFDAWRWKDSAKSLLNELSSFKNDLIQNYISGEGCFKEEYRYWKGANLFRIKAITISCLLADKSNGISQAQKEELISLIRLMARILWDENNAPINDSSGVGFGTANMPSMYLNTRYFFALLFPDDIEFNARAKRVAADVKNFIQINIYQNGSTFGTPHYTQPAIDPILFSMLQLKFAGVADYFRDEPRIRKFVDFYCSLLTPPSPRFGLNRKLVSFGDGSEESAVTFALLASGFDDINPSLSRQLYSIFQHGPRRLSPFGPVFLAADIYSDHQDKYPFRASNFTGYMSQLRLNSNSETESALWILNGDSLHDHRNDDAGELSMYMLKAPLSISRSCFYYPQATDARIRSVVIPHSLFTQWDKDNQPINERSLQNRTWASSSQEEYAALEYTQMSSSVFYNKATKWRRKVILIGKFEKHPIIIISDSIYNTEKNIWSMPFMSDGPVQTPAGPVIPEQKIHNNADKQQLPGATPAKALPPGINKFSFTGQVWNKQFHPAGGINWDLYVINSTPFNFNLGQWTSTWQNNEESKDFMQANGRPYFEGQQILRVQGGASFFNIIMPYNKGGKKPDELTEISKGLYLAQDEKDTLVFSQNGYWSKNVESITVGSWSRQSFTNTGFAINGGPAEMDITAKGIKVRIHGNSGARTFRVPMTGISTTQSSGQIKLSIQKGYTEWTINYVSKGLDLLSTEQGYTEYLFNIK